MNYGLKMPNGFTSVSEEEMKSIIAGAPAIVKVKSQTSGREYDLTPDAIEAAYRYRERQYRLEDAARHYEDGFGFPATVNELEAMVDRFFVDADCNVPENDTWERVIEELAREGIIN